MKNDSFKKYILGKLDFIHSELSQFNYRNLARIIDDIQKMVYDLEDDQIFNNQAIISELGRFLDQINIIEDPDLRMTINRRIDEIQGEIHSTQNRAQNVSNLRHIASISNNKPKQP